MSNNQDIQDEGGAWKYFSPMLHIDDDDLDAYQYRLLGHYRRVCGVNRGKCTESTKTTATITKMSTGKVSAVRKQLAELGRINLDIKRTGTTITLRDCWRENILRYSQPSPDEIPVDCSPHEQDVHHMNDSVHHMKQRTTVNNQETKKTLFASPDGNAAGDDFTMALAIQWQDAIDAMVELPDTKFQHHYVGAHGYLNKLLMDGKLTPDMDSEQVLAIVKQELVAGSDAPQQEAKPFYDKPAKPGNVSDKQYDGLRPTYALNAAVGNAYFPDSDIPKYRKIANHLLENHIPVDQFADYVVFVKRYYRERQWEFRWGSLDKGENITAWKGEGCPDVREPKPEVLEDGIEWVFPCNQPVVQYTDKPE